MGEYALVCSKIRDLLMVLDERIPLHSGCVFRCRVSDWSELIQ